MYEHPAFCAMRGTGRYIINLTCVSFKYFPVTQLIDHMMSPLQLCIQWSKILPVT